MNTGLIEYRLNRCLGAYAASQTTVLHMKRLNQTESPIFMILCVLCFQRHSFFTLFYSTVAGVVPCGGRKKSPCTDIIIVQVIFYFLWDH